MARAPTSDDPARPDSLAAGGPDSLSIVIGGVALPARDRQIRTVDEQTPGSTPRLALWCASSTTANSICAGDHGCCRWSGHGHWRRGPSPTRQPARNRNNRYDAASFGRRRLDPRASTGRRRRTQGLWRSRWFLTTFTLRSARRWGRRNLRSSETRHEQEPQT